MKRISVTMVRENLVDVPQYSLPDGFQLRLFSEGDEENWVSIPTVMILNPVTEFLPFENDHLKLTSMADMSLQDIVESLSGD